MIALLQAQGHGRRDAHPMMKIAQLTGIRQIKPDIPLYYDIVQVGMKLEVLSQQLFSVFYKSHSRFESNLMLNNGHLLPERIFFHFSFSNFLGTRS